MKTQHQINKTQEDTNEDQGILNEKTRLDLKFSNVWAVIISIATTSFIFGGVYVSMKSDVNILNTKLDMVITQQKELSQEFRTWKSQAETRLGTVESRQNVVVTYLNDHLKVNIK